VSDKKQSDTEASLKKYETLNRELIEALENLLSKGDWEATLFLQVNKKRIEDLRSRAQKLLDEVASKSENQKSAVIRKLPAGYKVFYISLYQVDVDNLAKWQNTIKALEKHSVSRPIYASEEHIRTWVRNKTDPAREAYVVAHVKESDIARPLLGKPVKDRFDHELITLKEGSIRLANIIEFVHNGKRHAYDAGRGILGSSN